MTPNDCPLQKRHLGAVGLDTMLSCAISLSHNDNISLSRLVEAMSQAPAQILGLECGRLAAGAPADIVVVDQTLSWKVEDATLRSRSKNSPFEHRHAGRPRRRNLRCRGNGFSNTLPKQQHFRHPGGKPGSGGKEIPASAGMTSRKRQWAATGSSSQSSAIWQAAFPLGCCLTRWAGLGDVRSIGSGNIGATNVLRTGQQEDRGSDAAV